MPTSCKWSSDSEISKDKHFLYRLLTGMVLRMTEQALNILGPPSPFRFHFLWTRSDCVSDWPGTCYVVQADFDHLVSTSGVLGLQMFTTMLSWAISINSTAFQR